LTKDGALNCGKFREPFPIGHNSSQIDLENSEGLSLRWPSGRNTRRMHFIVNNEPATFIYDFSFDRAFNYDLRAQFDGQIGQQVPANV
jgi:hypothetical protein